MSDTIRQPHTLLTGERLVDCRVAVVEGPDRGKTVQLERGRLTIGARSSCDLRLTDPLVSGTHAEVALLGDGVRVRDLNSTNGVRYMGALVESIVLQPGSLVSLGNTVIGILPPERSLPAIEATRYGSLIGHSHRMRQMFSLLARLEQTASTVLLEGETGTGKSLAAETIHHRSGRRGALITVDCGAISANLLPSELFGHRRGAFTGADADREGAIEAAAAGTLFLDEIGELPLELQPVLLRFLERGDVQRVGETRKRSIDARVIAATNKSLKQQVEAGLFRQDLFYRLSVIRVKLPALRSCPEDILPLASHFARQHGCQEQLTSNVVATLQSYPWPGNVRQLSNAIQRLATLGTVLDISESEPQPIRINRINQINQGSQGRQGPSGPVERNSLGSQGSPTPAELQDFHDAKRALIADFERHYLTELLRSHRGNLSAASRDSGLARHHLRRLLKKHLIDPEQFR